jgi:hypothetical protein
VLVHVGFGGFGRDQRENKQIHYDLVRLLVGHCDIDSNAKLESIFLWIM